MALLIEQLSLHVGERQLLNDFNLSVTAGQVTTLMGPSGCGKSSLLDVIMGTLSPALKASGTVSLNGAKLDGVPTEKRDMGVLFQDALLFPHLTVGQNLGFGCRVKDKAERIVMIEQALTDAGLQGFAERNPASLSGGEKARVALLRTLLAKPKALLLDEPFAKLDRHLRQSFRRFVFAQVQGLNIPVLMVTHDHEDAQAAAGPVIHMPSLTKSEDT